MQHHQTPDQAFPEPPSLPGAAAGHVPHLHDGLSLTLFCGLLGIDIVGFGPRPASLYPDLRDALENVLDASLTGVGVEQPDYQKEDRGDAVFVVFSPGVSLELLLGPYPSRLQDQLRRHNRRSAPDAQLRVRVAVNGGFVWAGRHGIVGRAANNLFRLLDAPQFKDVLDETNADLGLITTGHLYRELVEDGPGLIDPDAYLPITVGSKEFHGPARIWLPPVKPTLAAPDAPVPPRRPRTTARASTRPPYRHR